MSTITDRALPDARDDPTGGRSVGLSGGVLRHGRPALYVKSRGGEENPRRIVPFPLSRIGSLVKPHYELSDEQKRTLLVDGVLAPQHAEEILRSVLDGFPDYGCEVLAVTVSPLGGAKSARRSGGKGNREYLVLAKAR